jgi:hypothetical protein
MAENLCLRQQLLVLAQGQVLEGELTMAADEEREEPKQVEHEGDHEP